MSIVRLSVLREKLDEVPLFASEQPYPVVLDCRDADTVIAVAALKGEWRSGIGVWLHLSPEYPAQLAARDVATLSWLVALDHVVVGAAVHADQYAQVVRALLSDDEVNFSNEVATLAKAYNRPAPPRDLVVWSHDGPSLVNGDVTLAPERSTTVELGEFTLYS